MPHNWTILCDFDGTISIGDVTDRLLERFGQAGWEELENAWKLGEIGSLACMAGQIALLDATPAELDAAIAEIAIDPAFPAFVAAALAAKIPLTVVSDGLDRAIHGILARYGLDHLPVVANRLVAATQRSWHLEFPHSSPRCCTGSGACKCATGERLAALDGPRRILLIGDGSSDFCLAKRADFVFAKHSLAAHCHEHGIAHRVITDFEHALTALPALLEQPVPSTSIPIPS